MLAYYAVLLYDDMYLSQFILDIFKIMRVNMSDALA